MVIGHALCWPGEVMASSGGCNKHQKTSMSPLGICFSSMCGVRRLEEAVENSTVDPTLVSVRCRLKRLLRSSCVGVNVRDHRFARPYQRAASHTCICMHCHAGSFGCPLITTALGIGGEGPVWDCR